MANQELLKAASQGDTEKVMRLLDNGRLINDEAGNKALVAAAEAGQVALVEALATAGADVNGGFFRSGMTPLMRAAQYGKTHVVTQLLDRGAEINGRGAGGMTPLMLAASKGQHEAMMILLNRGADTRLRDYSGNTAMSLVEAEVNRMQNYPTPDEISNPKMQAVTKKLYQDIITILSAAAGK